MSQNKDKKLKRKEIKKKKNSREAYSLNVTFANLRKSMCALYFNDLANVPLGIVLWVFVDICNSSICIHENTNTNVL